MSNNKDLNASIKMIATLVIGLTIMFFMAVGGLIVWVIVK